jgi:hypothetical protein
MSLSQISWIIVKSFIGKQTFLLFDPYLKFTFREMMWPKLFSNRDYVFIRKHFIDRQRNLILIVNKSTKHPNVPVKKGLQRVKEYWSFMVIKPKTTFDQPGVEFILTYFDHPGKSQNIRVQISDLSKNNTSNLFLKREQLKRF